MKNFFLNTAVVLLYCTGTAFSLGLIGLPALGEVAYVGLFLTAACGLMAGLFSTRGYGSGEPLVPAKHAKTDRTRKLRPCEFSLAHRTQYMILLTICGLVVLGVAAGFGVLAHKEKSMPRVFAWGLVTMFASIGVFLFWLATQALAARVLLNRDGVTVHMPFSHGMFAWGEVIGFERVRRSNGKSGYIRQFRLVTAARSYLIADELDDRALFIRTVTQGCGLELIDLG